MGCKAGFSHIFDDLVPDICGNRIYDIYGGGGGLVYLPSCMNKPNGHYSATVRPDIFADFVKSVHDTNRIMISERNDPDSLILPGHSSVFVTSLRRSMSYFTKKPSSEIMASNYRSLGHDVGRTAR